MLKQRNNDNCSQLLFITAALKEFKQKYWYTKQIKSTGKMKMENTKKSTREKEHRATLGLDVAHDDLRAAAVPHLCESLPVAPLEISGAHP